MIWNKTRNNNYNILEIRPGSIPFVGNAPIFFIGIGLYAIN